jgi:predicted ATPase
MRFGVLGSLKVVGDDGDRRDPTAGRQRQLLLALLVRREPVHVDRLVDVLCGDGPQLPRDPAAAVRTYVTRLRQALEPDRGTRLVTLSGVGGVGKTRLAIAVAHRLRGSLDVALVDLADVSDRRDVVDAVFASLRLPAAARSDHLAGLVRVLRSRAALLVLDNCEHVLGAVADVVDRLPRDCPDLTVLSTSREAIGIDGEHTYHVPSLSLADGAYHEAELHRAVEILAACRAAPRSQASFALYTHDRDLLRARVPRHDRAAIIDAARGVDPADLLDRELTAHR